MHMLCGPIRPLHLIHGYFGQIRFREQVLEYEYIPAHTPVPYNETVQLKYVESGFNLSCSIPLPLPGKKGCQGYKLLVGPL